MTWFFPAYNGDFRLVPIDVSSYRDTVDNKDTCVLEVVDPTPAERESLAIFMTEANKKKWTAQTSLNGEARQDVLLDASLADAGKLLLTVLKPAERTITAVRSEGGKIVVHDTAELLADPKAGPKKKDKAVSTSRPTPSCPQCVPGAISRASEVLLSFLSPEEHACWAANRYIVVTGGITGNRYILAHRHSPLAVRVGRICYDLDDELVIHFHDNSVPPEEEVLAAKLILEHREPWLRNEATLFYQPRITSRTVIFKNPFGDIRDGVADAGFTQGFGNGLLAFLGGGG